MQVPSVRKRGSLHFDNGASPREARDDCLLRYFDTRGGRNHFPLCLERARGVGTRRRQFDDGDEHSDDNDPGQGGRIVVIIGARQVRCDSFYKSTHQQETKRCVALRVRQITSTMLFINVFLQKSHYNKQDSYNKESYFF